MRRLQTDPSPPKTDLIHCMTAATFDPNSMLRAVLVRLVRIAVGRGLSYQAFARLLRSVYFEVGSTYEPVKGKPNSDSRISLLTGLPRREVRSLREQAAEPEPPKPSLERLVMNAWSSNPDLLDDAGNLIPLHRTIRLGGQRSFEALVGGVSKDIRARSLLDEWVRRRYVFVDAEDRVHITHRRPDFGMEGVAGAALLIGELNCDLLSGFEQVYLLGRQVPGYCFQVVYGHRLTADSAQIICAQALREGTEMANRLNRLIVERETFDRNHRENDHRVSFGFGAYQTEFATEPGLLALDSGEATES
jgi:Family of unknown function (DUF6502)